MRQYRLMIAGAYVQPGDLVVIQGGTETGKTELLRMLIAQNEPRLLAIDDDGSKVLQTPIGCPPHVPGTLDMPLLRELADAGYLVVVARLTSVESISPKEADVVIYTRRGDDPIRLRQRPDRSDVRPPFEPRGMGAEPPDGHPASLGMTVEEAGQRICDIWSKPK